MTKLFEKSLMDFLRDKDETRAVIIIPVLLIISVLSYFVFNFPFSKAIGVSVFFIATIYFCVKLFQFLQFAKPRNWSREAPRSVSMIAFLLIVGATSLTKPWKHFDFDQSEPMPATATKKDTAKIKTEVAQVKQKDPKERRKEIKDSLDKRWQFIQDSTIAHRQQQGVDTIPVTSVVETPAKTVGSSAFDIMRRWFQQAGDSLRSKQEASIAKAASSHNPIADTIKKVAEAVAVLEAEIKREKAAVAEQKRINKENDSLSNVLCTVKSKYISFLEEKRDIEKQRKDAEADAVRIKNNSNCNVNVTVKVNGKPVLVAKN